MAFPLHHDHMNSNRWTVPSLVGLALVLIGSPASAQVSISVGVAPPPLIVEDQPPIPAEGYLWTPGYWAFDQDQGSYYWVDGSWEQPPEVGLLWTPNYWGWDNGFYAYHEGYWGPTVGFYGGINYGFGYFGDGYGGGRWQGGHFFYNTAVNRVNNANIHNTYIDKTVVRNGNSRVSFNGGHGGIQARPTARQEQAAHESHTPATGQQQSHFQSAMQSRSHAVKVDAKKAGTEAGDHPMGAGTTGEERKKDTGATHTENHTAPMHQEGTEEKPAHKEKHTEHMASPESHTGGGMASEPKHQQQHATHAENHPQEHHTQAPKPEAKAKPASKPEGNGKPDKHN